MPLSEMHTLATSAIAYDLRCVTHMLRLSSMRREMGPEFWATVPAHTIYNEAARWRVVAAFN